MWLFSLFLILPLAACQLSGTGLTVVLNGVAYFISPYPAGNVTLDSGFLSNVDTIHGLAPISVVQDAVHEADLPALFGNWTSFDDVFQDGFTRGVFLSTGPASPARTLKRNKNETAYNIMDLDSAAPSGPYFVNTLSGALHPVFRLYDDFAGSFTAPLLQKPDGTFQPLSAQVATSATMTIGVPSRLYYTKTAQKPLAGVRVGVKDIFKLKGAKSSYGNRAWYSLYPASNATASAIQRLIDAGAVIVGLQKASQFANGETATADWVDYHSPFNPRGDGYQDPSSSSSGAGASIASYEWLDLAVGSDTGGSIRGPSRVQGLFGNRPSHGLVDLDNVMPLSEHLDTAGFLTRDPYVWDAAQRAMYAENYTSLVDSARNVTYPTTIYTVGFPVNGSDSDADAILVDFANKLAHFVSGQVTVLDLAAEWAASNVAEARGSSLSQYLNMTYPTLIAGEQTALVRDAFYEDYAAAHDGRLPFVDPAPLARWQWFDSQPADALDQAVANKTVFMDWFNSEILAPVDSDGQCSSRILLYSEGVSQSPRNMYLDPPSAPWGYSEGRISPFSECPDSVFPLGQVSRWSDITRHNESIPVTVNVMAAKGCDGLLVKLAQDLAAKGIIVVPKVGQTVYGGDVLM